MKYLSVWIIGILLFSGCLDFLDEDDENGAPVAVIKIEGDSPFEPDTDIIFSGKGSNDPDNDILEYYWDFDDVRLGYEGDKWKVIEEIKPDIIALGYDQDSYTKGLEKGMLDRKLKVKIIRLESYMPEKYKSSLIKKSID